MKINSELYEKIMSCGKKVLLEKSYNDLTMRYIAGECNVSVGTVYNCFPSKEMLVAKIMLKDWLVLLDKASQEIEETSSCIYGLETVYNTIRSYVTLYSGVFESRGSEVNLHVDQHKTLIGQLSSLIDLLLTRFGKSTDPDPTLFLAEALLLAGCRRDITFNDISIFINRVIQ